jgi:hypothetical protein
MNPATVAQYDSDSLRKPESVQLEFCGRTGEYFQIWLVNLALSLASCGLYMPWARVRTRRYFLSQTRVKASGFDYQANPWAMFAGWLVIGVGLGLVSNSRELLAMGLASATKLLLKNLGRLSELADLVEPLVYLGVGIAFLLLQMLVLSWLVMQSLRYNASKTSYRNLRFGFGSSEARFRLWREMVFLLGLRFLVPLSLGVLQPYVGWRWRRFLIRHRRFGTTPFAFTATPADFLRLHGRALTLLLPAIGRLASRVGPLRLIWMASLAIVPLALLWLPSRNVAYLCGVQVVAGACWAAYELAVTLIFFQEVHAEERTGVVSVYNLGVALATVAGAATGGLILRSLGETWQAYATVFAVSCVARLAVIPVLRRAMATV